MTSKNDKLEKSKNYWLNEPNKFTDLYNTKKILHLPSKIFLKKRMEIIQKYLKEDNNATVVDVGCGSGEFANILKKYYGNVIGIDISDKMINFARKNSEKNITFQINECTNISLKDNSVDYIFALGLLDYVENLQNVFFEFKRILKKKGKIIITIPKNPSLFVPFRWSNKLRYILFDAPPVVNAISKNALISLIKNNNLELKELTSLWTTTWIALIVFN